MQTGNHGAPVENLSLSVVVPVYGCVRCLVELCDRLEQALAAVTARYEIILVDDRSPDAAWEVIEHLAAERTCVSGLRLSRNFGQHLAITAGLEVAKGDLVVVMDCDLQDPPEKIVDLVNKWREGHDLVLAKRIERSHSLFRVASAKLYFWMMSRLTEEPIDGSYGSFCLLTRQVVEAYLRFKEQDRHFLFILRWLGFNVGTVEYVHVERLTGKTSYSLRRLVRHALDGIFFQTTVFLRWIVVAGLLFGVLGVVSSAYLVYQYIAISIQPGWTSLAVLVLLSTGMVLLSVGVTGLYIGKIFQQEKGRPLFIIDRHIRQRSW